MFINELLLNLHHSECFPKGKGRKILFFIFALPGVLFLNILLFEVGCNHKLFHYKGRMEATFVLQHCLLMSVHMETLD